MDYLLEEQAKIKEKQSEMLRETAVYLLETGDLTKEVLELLMKKTFKLGHNAVHCRGESYKWSVRY